MKHKLIHINEIFDIIEKKEISSDEGTPMGFEELDKATGGLQPGSMYVVAARPGMGKTAFILRIARNFTFHSNKAVVYFTLGESSEQLVKRLLSLHSNIDARILHSGNLREDEKDRLNTAQNIVRSRNLFFNSSAKDIKSIKKTLQGFSNLGLVIIDYIQLLTSEFKKGSRVREGHYITSTIEQMALELNVPIIVTSQIPRFERKNRLDLRPNLNDLRKEPWDFLEPVAAVMLFLYRDAYYDVNSYLNNVECIIAKNRFGKTGTIPLHWNVECGFFADTDGEFQKEKKDDTQGFTKAYIFDPTITKNKVWFRFICNNGKSSSTLKENGIITVGISKDKGSKFAEQIWRDVIPFEVSDSPRILLSGKERKKAQSSFSQQEMKKIFNFIKCNKEAISQFWAGEIDFLEFDKKLK